MSGTLVFSHSPHSIHVYNFRTIGLQLQIVSYTAHCKNQQSFIIVAMGALSQTITIGEIG